MLASGRPVTILRATQFHEFAQQMVDRGPGPLVLAPRMRSQPIAARRGGRGVGHLGRRAAAGSGAGAGRTGAARDGRPRSPGLRARGLRRLVLPLRVPGAAGRAMAEGRLLPTGPGPRGRRRSNSGWPDPLRAATRGPVRHEPGHERADDLAEDYERARPHLIRVAYAILGSRAEAEDVVSEAWLRLSAADAPSRSGTSRHGRRWRLPEPRLDTLRSARMRRETYVGPWLPEPMLDLPAAQGDPADRVTLDDTVSFALLVVLESSPRPSGRPGSCTTSSGVPFAEVADVVGRTPQAVRQLAARARGHIREREPRVEIHAAQHSDTVAASCEPRRGATWTP